jgi:hypothetical protein
VGGGAARGPTAVGGGCRGGGGGGAGSVVLCFVCVCGREGKTDSAYVFGDGLTVEDCTDKCVRVKV